MNNFKLISNFKPTGDQPQAIRSLTENIKKNKKYQTLLGVTGSGKTFTLACMIEQINRPTLVISHNKTLASQLYAEFKDFFPENSVEYFVSYYDYYQPESYIPQTDTYIEKDASINDRLDRLRLAATSSLNMRRDVLIVASVSCIYNLGSPSDYQNMTLWLTVSEPRTIEDLLKSLAQIQYERNDIDFARGKFRVRGDIVDIFPSYAEEAFRIEFLEDKIDKIYEFNPLSGKKTAQFDKIGIYPAKHFIIAKDNLSLPLKTIKKELEERLQHLETSGKLLEAQRLKQRTLFDLEMLSECSYCHGIENYSRHLSQRPAGSRPYCLIDYFPGDFLTVIDESHVTIPQIKGMYEGDKSRKTTLVDYGFRLPSCLDNRPLKFNEFMDITGQMVFVSATPGPYEINLSQNRIIEQVIRPTGLLDPEIIVKKTENQIDDLAAEIIKRSEKNERTLVTTLTKKMSEELSSYLIDSGLKVTYLHSEINTIERAKILSDLRKKKFDALVGVNLLREGLDLPEVSLVAILDADKEGFLRSATSLIQVAGRSARNINAQVYMYADRISGAMRKAIDESNRRRAIQAKYNTDNKIKPESIKKGFSQGIEIYFNQKEHFDKRLGFDDSEIDTLQALAQLEKEMLIAAKNLHFEKAAELRDKIKDLKAALRLKD
ncbi:MAG: excinuclease ABC subunit UvrB [Candidatus Omnitrophica bacterium]|nr:excinuclease ABC subunit UvrB [Candidatus Omnitrophota bacterium]